MDKKTEVVFILDRSGSMRGLEADTIGGFNGMLEKQKKLEGEVLISTLLFDNECEVLHDRKPIQSIEPITENEYYVRGCTALLDAVGGAVHHIGNVHKYARDEDRPEKTMFVIITDGLENASKHYTRSKVKEMIERQQERFGWEFVFLGANMDAIKEARRYGIRESRASNFVCNERGTEMNYKAVDKLMFCLRSCEEFDEDWKSEIEEYVKQKSSDSKENMSRKGKGTLFSRSKNN